MAAGRVDVLRRRDFGGYRKKESDYYHHHNNGYRCGLESNQFRDHGVRYGNGSNGNRLPSKERDLDSRSAEFHRRKDGVDVAQVKSGESWTHEGVDEVQAPPQKKKKFSPIIWDLEEKSLSKNRVVPASSIETSPPQCVVSGSLDGYVAKHPVLANQLGGLEVSSVELVESPIPKSSAVGSPPFSILLEEEEEFGGAWNIESSRWASDSSSPSDILLSGGEETPNKEERFRSSSSSRTVGDTRSSTPESGEICRDRSGGDWGKLSVERDRSLLTHRDDEYCEDELQNDDVMSIGDTLDDSAGVGQAESEVEEPMVPSHRSLNMLQGCRSLYEFEKLNKINEGSYGIVYRARDKNTNEIVALKKVKMNMGKEYLEYGFPLSALREINILLSFNHPSIVNVKEVVMGSDLDSVYMVMEYMEHDLKGLMDKMKQKKQQRFSTSEVKCLMQQLLEGVNYLHDNWVMHRDLKTSNILLNNNGELKICDFGISRQYGSPMKPYTPLVVTLHYRAPELLLGAKQYSTAIDMWSVGCIMAELLTNEPLFNGKTEVDQLRKIFKVLGTPNEMIWPGFSALPGAKASFANQPYNLLRGKFPVTSFTGSPVLSDSGFDLLNKLLTYDPEKQITADAALNHEWFSEVPLPKDKEFMPTFPPQYAQR